MDNVFLPSEKLYRAVYPPSNKQMFWKKDGSVSSAAFHDPDGLSVERGDYRSDESVIADMKKFFTGCIISVTAGQCKAVEATIKHKPTGRSAYHSEIHGNPKKALLSPSQRKQLAKGAKIEYYEE